MPLASRSTRKSLAIIATWPEQPVPFGLLSEKPKSPMRAKTWSAKVNTGRPVISAWAITRPETGSVRTSVIAAFLPSLKIASSCALPASGVAATSHPSAETANAFAVTLRSLVSILAIAGHARSMVSARLGKLGVRTICTIGRPGIAGSVAVSLFEGASDRPIKPPAAAAAKATSATSGHIFGRPSSEPPGGRCGSCSLTEHLPLRLLDLLSIAAVDEALGQGPKHRPVIPDYRKVRRFADVERAHHRTHIVRGRQCRDLGTCKRADFGFRIDPFVISFYRIDDAEIMTGLVRQNDPPGRTQRESPPEFRNGGRSGKSIGAALHHLAGSEVAHPADVTGAADILAARVQPPGRERKAECFAYDRACAQPGHQRHAGQCKIMGRFEHQHRHRHWSADDCHAHRRHADERRVGGVERGQPADVRCGTGEKLADKRTDE